MEHWPRETGSETDQQQALQELENIGRSDLNKFLAGQLEQYCPNRKSIAKRSKERPRNICALKIQHSTKEKEIINSEIRKLLDKGVIAQCDGNLMSLFPQFLQERRKMAPLERF